MLVLFGYAISTFFPSSNLFSVALFCRRWSKKCDVSILNVWQVQAGTDQTERYKPIRQWKTNSCAAANFKIETLQGPAKTINRSELNPHFFFLGFFVLGWEDHSL